MSVTFYPNYIHSVGFSKTAEPSITGETYSCSGGETSGPAYDLVDNRNSSLVTLDTNAQTTTIALDFDLTANITAGNFAIIDNHNFKTSDASIGLSVNEAGTVLNFSSAYSGPLGTELTTTTVASNNAQVGNDGVDGVLLLNTSTTYTDNNIEINITDYGNDNYDADMTIGEVAFGVKCTPTISPDVNQAESIMYGNSISQSRGGQKHAVQYHGKRRAWTLGWKILQESDMTNLKTVWDTCEGSLYPFWIDLGEGSSNPLLYYVRFVGDFNYTKLTNQAYSLRLQIEEEL